MPDTLISYKLVCNHNWQGGKFVKLMPWMSDAPVIQSSAFQREYIIFGKECELTQS